MPVITYLFLVAKLAKLAFSALILVQAGHQWLRIDTRTIITIIGIRVSDVEADTL